MTIVYLNHQTLSGPLCEKSVFRTVKISTMTFWRRKNQKLSFIPKKEMTIKFQSLYIRLLNFI